MATHDDTRRDALPSPDRINPEDFIRHEMAKQ